MRSEDLVLFGKIAHMVAARGNRRQLRVEPIDPLIGVHVQLGNKPTSDKPSSDFRHRRFLFGGGCFSCLHLCAKVEPLGLRGYGSFTSIPALSKTAAKDPLK